MEQEQYLLRLPKTVKTELMLEAKRIGISLNSYIIFILRERKNNRKGMEK